MKYDKPITKFCNTAAEIIETVANSVDGDCIGIKPGVYEFIGGNKVVFRDKHNVTLRSVSGSADDVIFKGSGFHKQNGYKQTPIDEPICIASGNDGIVIHGITFRDSNCHGIKVQGEGNNSNITIDSCKFFDICERMIKGSAKDGCFVKGITITNNYFEDTQTPVESDHMDVFEGDYIAGIDMMVLDGALISNNKFVNIKGKNGGARGAIFIWVGSKNITAERNIIVNCDRGICYGNPGNTSVDGGNISFFVDGGIIRNNFIVEPVSHGIELANTNNVTVCNNTIFRINENERGITETSLSEERRSKGLVIADNIVCGVINTNGADINIKEDQCVKPEFFTNYLHL